MFKIDNFEMNIIGLNRKRMVRVYLPSDYEINTSKSYKVLYMHDGHNLFYKETSAYGDIWDIQSTLSKREAEGKESLIVVGVDCNQEGGRLDEYSPWVNNNLSEIIASRNIPTAGGEGAIYSDFIVNILKPYIDRKYRTLKDRDNTFIAGSSMGAFISLYIGYKYNEVFSCIGAFSTAIWFKKDNLFQFIKENFKDNSKVYLDIGTEETSDKNNKAFSDIYLNDTIELNKLLLDLGQPKENLLLIVDEGAIHSEIAWKNRFPNFLEFINVDKKSKV